MFLCRVSEQRKLRLCGESICGIPCLFLSVPSLGKCWYCIQCLGGPQRRTWRADSIGSFRDASSWNHTGSSNGNTLRHANNSRDVFIYAYCKPIDPDLAFNVAGLRDDDYGASCRKTRHPCGNRISSHEERFRWGVPPFYGHRCNPWETIGTPIVAVATLLYGHGASRSFVS